jgi:hypothetical protein
MHRHPGRIGPSISEAQRDLVRFRSARESGFWRAAEARGPDPRLLKPTVGLVQVHLGWSTDSLPPNKNCGVKVNEAVTAKVECQASTWLVRLTGRSGGLLTRQGDLR